MLALDFSNKRQPTYQFDTKSEVSTEGDQTPDYHTHQTFVFPHRQRTPLSNPPKSKLKSSLCKNFTEKGTCPYGSKCQFAHGTQELKINEDTNNSYKTKPCNAFFKKGHCQYGYRCNFVHRKEEEEQQGENCHKWKIMYKNHREVFQNLKESESSRLLRLIQ